MPGSDAESCICLIVSIVKRIFCFFNTEKRDLLCVNFPLDIARGMFIIYFVLTALLQNINIILPYAMKFMCLCVCMFVEFTCMHTDLLVALEPYDSK